MCTERLFVIYTVRTPLPHRHGTDRRARKREQSMITRRMIVRSLVASPVAALALHPQGRSFLISRAQGNPVKIGSKNFTEELILGEMYAQLLENAGIPVERHLNLGGTEVAQKAL